MLKDKGLSFKGSNVVVSGSGNVSIYAMEKATQFGAKVIACSDSNGYIYDPNGININTVKKLKEVERKRISDYIIEHSEAEYYDDCKNIWSVPCDIALPCATQNEIDKSSAEILVSNGVIAIGEGANMPSTSCYCFISLILLSWHWPSETMAPLPCGDIQCSMMSLYTVEKRRAPPRDERRGHGAGATSAESRMGCSGN